MKAGLGLLVVTFSLVAVAQAEYQLSCAKSELSIRWPSYESHSEYFVCPRLFGRPMIVSCNPGEVFTFVLQSCTSPNRYIPAPGLSVLPTASPVITKPITDGYLKPLEIPNHPPVLSPPVINVPVPTSQVRLPTPLTVEVTRPVYDVTHDHETKPIHKEEEQNAVAVDEETSKTLAPMPPTPPPTPPVVGKVTNKKPGIASGKKSTTKKKSNSTTKKPKAAASGKKTPPKKNVKQPPNANKSPKKSAKKPKATDKKSQKS